MKWFTRRRGVAIGIALSGSGFGYLCAAPVLAYVIITYGWRMAFLIAGMSTFLIMFSSALVMKSSPQDIGLRPYGEELGTEQQSDVGQQETAGIAQDLTIREATRRTEFWLLYILWFFSTIMASIYNQHTVLFAITLGISSIIGSLALGTIGFSSILGRLTIGLLLDRIGIRRALIFCFLLNLTSAVLLMVTKNELLLYMFAVIFGFSLGGRITLEVPLASGFFGLRNLGAVLGILETAFGIGGFIGPYLAGYMFDLAGRYYEVFLFCVLLSISLSILTTRFKLNESAGSRGS